MLTLRDEAVRLNPGRPLKLRVDEDFFDCMNFYRSMYGMERVLLPVELEPLGGPADFYYGFTRNEPAMAAQGARPLYRHAQSETVLCVRDAAAAPGRAPRATDSGASVR